MTAPVVVVGGGITGVTAAWTLHRAGVDVVLCEASERLGGKLLLGSVAGQPAELGADAFLARNPAAGSLARRLGLGDDLVAPATGSVWLWLDGHLRPLPAGTVLGAPTDPIALARSRVLGPGALARAGLDLALPRRRIAGDQSVAALVGERFGSAVVDTLVEPLLGGVYAGNPNQLSAEATVPQITSAARDHRSLLRGLRASRRTQPPADGPVFQTLAGGLERLVGAMASDLGDRVRMGAAVDAIEPGDDGWQVSLRDGDIVAAAQVVLAAPAWVTAPLLASVAPDASAELGQIPYASVAVIALAYPRAAAAALPDGSGVLVPRTQGRLVKAITFVSRKWPHRDTGDHVLLRASVGRIDDDRWRSLGHDDLVARVDAEVRWATGITHTADDAVVVPWEGGLPQYLVGHVQRVDRIRANLPAGLHVAGAGYDGVGISPCVASAERAAAAVLG
jgi:protoporphyrinogen/coproporphyrinogen III oxidase